MKTNDIRQAFLDYFAKHKHQVVPSSSLVPANDPTLLFTNAGMVQFKDVFLGREHVDYTCATSSQRCVRAGGKHNDLDNVGYTARHHTFFEMLGNFSFGDYFKREAIEFAWNLLTKDFKLPPEKLWVTVYKDDEEAADIWLNELKVSPDRFTYCGEKDNFWSMGDTGPCGPCTEIFYDHGEHIPGGPPGSPDEDADRYVEIWNLVFMQYNRQADGELQDLPKPSVDTGMGLERIAAVLQGVHSNYDIDIFKNLAKAILTIAGRSDVPQTALNVISDHIRSTVFLISDGVVPSNEGRGYVLRRIMRRAIRHGAQAGLTDTFFHKLVKPLVIEMGDAYPELKAREKHITETILHEEEQFAVTLEQGLKILSEAIASLKGHTIPGDVVFKLYDTFGFPVDLTADIAREKDLQIDVAGFEAEMQVQRTQSKQASQFAVDYNQDIVSSHETTFSGYDHTAEKATIAAIYQNNESVMSLSADIPAAIVLDHTPFYAESGGQVGDSGELLVDGAVFMVADTQKHGQAYFHYGQLNTGEIKVGQHVQAEVDGKRRHAIMLNHSATHLVHAALRQILGAHVIQKGSLVEAKRLRFDFTHPKVVTQDELRRVERLVNEQIRKNIESHIDIMSPKEAQKTGAMALFGEKYGDKVRVLSMGDFSKELCGGTHVERSGDIGLFKITSETGIAAGIRRIEAITGDDALDWIDHTSEQLNTIANVLKTDAAKVTEKVEQLAKLTRQQEKEIARLQSKLASTQSGDLLSTVEEVNGVKVLIRALSDIDAKQLRTTLDQLKNQLGEKAVIVLYTKSNERLNVIAGITKAMIGQGPAPKDLVQLLCGKGGGRDDMAQGGCAVPGDLDKKLEAVREAIAQSLSS